MWFAPIAARTKFSRLRAWTSVAPRGVLSRVVGVGVLGLFLLPLLHCDRPTPTGAEEEAIVAPAPETPPADPQPATAPDPSADPLGAAKASIAEARRRYEKASGPIDLDVYRVEYALLLRKELENLGLPKSSLGRLSVPELAKLARRKGLMD